MKIEIYTRASCSFCYAAKRLLATQDLPYEEYSLDRDPALMGEMIERTGNRTVPQVIIDDRSIGGFRELSEIDLGGLLAGVAGIR
jgi:glutaredoxin 3